ncbi:hypothetical protein SGLAM104S_06349 [Streptomyces glaucescens]
MDAERYTASVTVESVTRAVLSALPSPLRTLLRTSAPPHPRSPDAAHPPLYVTDLAYPARGRRYGDEDIELTSRLRARTSTSPCAIRGTRSR